jgi:hypothetical protein
MIQIVEPSLWRVARFPFRWLTFPPKPDPPRQFEGGGKQPRTPTPARAGLIASPHIQKKESTATKIGV